MSVMSIKIIKFYIYCLFLLIYKIRLCNFYMTLEYKVKAFINKLSI